MKTNIGGIKEVFAGESVRRAAERREGCPEPEILVRGIRAELDGKRRTEVIEHVSHCLACAREAKWLLDVRGEEDRFVRRIESLGRLRASEGCEEKRSWLGHLSRNPAVIAASVLLAAAAVSITLLHRSPLVRRGGDAPLVRLLAPGDTVASKTNLRFAWREVPGMRAYTVEVFDSTLDLLWRSEPISGAEAKLPPELLAKLDAGAAYFWMVTASGPGGTGIKSRLAEFRISS